MNAVADRAKKNSEDIVTATTSISTVETSLGQKITDLTSSTST
jgi:hypothetical protein